MNLRKHSFSKSPAGILPLEHRAKSYRSLRESGRDDLLAALLVHEHDPYLIAEFASGLANGHLGVVEGGGCRQVYERLHLRVFGKALYSLTRLGGNVKQIASDYAFHRWSGHRIGTFNVHPSAEFRSRDQIAISPPFTAKARAILNGRSTLDSHGIQLAADAYIKEGAILDAYGGLILTSGPLGVSQSVFIHGGGGVRMGAYVIIGPHACIIASNHRFDDSLRPIMLQGDNAKGITIGDNVWIGANACILDGVEIGSNVVIGAGAVVTSSVDNDMVVTGNREQRSRPLFRFGKSSV